MHSGGLHIPGLAEDKSAFTDLLRTAATLAAPERRAEAAAQLARAVGGTDLLFFIRDPEINTFIVAPGFRPAIPSGKAWKSFLAECVRTRQHTGQLPYERSGEITNAIGIAPSPDAVLVVLGTESIHGVEWIRELIPLFAGMFRGEQSAVLASAVARMAADSTTRTEAMAQVLARSRDELEVALVEAEAASSAAVEATRVKSEFLATMSHELRTPLNAIGGYSQLLAMGIHGAVTREQKETLKRIDRSQRHLLALINDVLNLSRLEAGKISYQISAVDVEELMRDVMPMIDPQVALKGISQNVKIPPGVCVSADRDKLVQILLNLLSNAIKFTNTGGSITVATKPDPANAGIVWISVSDTGRGIPPEKIDLIFEPFIQVDAGHSRAQQGAGLGLAISRDLARGMGGDIHVTSKIGGGSTFVVALTAAE